MGTQRQGDSDRPPLPLLAPMLATSAPGLPGDQDRWSFEAKLDGFRTICLVDHGEVRLRSRAGKPMRLPPELGVLGQEFPDRRLILDGEIVALVDGRPSLTALQQRMRTRRATPTSAPVQLIVFDLLFLDEKLLVQRPFRQRRSMLEDLDLNGPGHQTVLSLRGEGEAMLAAVRQQELEGVMAKRLDSPYQPGRRSRDWLKILYRRRLQVTVGGYIPATGEIAALLVGQPDPQEAGRLRFLGRVDHGFRSRTRQHLAVALTPLETDRSPFTGPVDTGGGWGHAPGPPPRWVRPVLQVAVEHVGRDPATDQVRHPSFAGLDASSA